MTDSDSPALYNPFDEGEEERLRYSAISPGLLNYDCSKPREEGLRWSIDSKAVLMPANIDEKHIIHQDGLPCDQDSESRIQAAIDSFFATHEKIVPSPWSSASSTKQVKFSPHPSICLTSDDEDHSSKTTTVATQTTVSLPIDFDLEAHLNENYRLRRKLQFPEDESLHINTSSHFSSSPVRNGTGDDVKRSSACPSLDSYLSSPVMSPIDFDRSSSNLSNSNDCSKTLSDDEITANASEENTASPRESTRQVIFQEMPSEQPLEHISSIRNETTLQLNEDSGYQGGRAAICPVLSSTRNDATATNNDSGCEDHISLSIESSNSDSSSSSTNISLHMPHSSPMGSVIPRATDISEFNLSKGAVNMQLKSIDIDSASPLRKISRHTTSPFCHSRKTNFITHSVHSERAPALTDTLMDEWWKVRLNPSLKHLNNVS